jgi:hypothetical protein
MDFSWKTEDGKWSNNNTTADTSTTGCEMMLYSIRIRGYHVPFVL